MPDHLNQAADMEIDHNGVIHVVWCMQISSWHWKIMYAYSEDDGQTWSEPLDLLQNTDLWMYQPHIACDSKNNLYVTYDYATGTPYKMVHMKVYNGQQWSEPILVSEGLPGSDYNKVVVDNEDRVIVFWGYQEVNVKYRIYQNNSFSEIMEPYFNAMPDSYYLYYSTIDTNNYFHWVGYTTEGMPSGTFAHAYFLYDPINNQWDIPQNISIVKAQIGNAIDLLQNQNPVLVIREDTTHWPTSYNDITFLLEKDGINWLPHETVANAEGNQKHQQIIVDQYNDVHIVETEEMNICNKMVHYQKTNDQWVGYIIDSTTNFCNPTKLLFHNNKLYLVYFKDNIPGTPDDDIFFAKYDIVTGQAEQSVRLPDFKVYPNPGRSNIYIEFENNETQHINLSVFDITGQQIVTLINEIKPRGTYRQLWKVTDKYRKENAPCLYLVRLKSGRKTVTQTVEIIK